LLCKQVKCAKVVDLLFHALRALQLDES
jgi:hypothetical protein